MTNGFPAWPAWLPGGSGLVFHNTVRIPTSPDADSPISTWNGAQGELWYVDVPTGSTSTAALALGAVNGKGYLPTSALHPSDAVLNYEPTINPVASGGYYW